MQAVCRSVAVAVIVGAAGVVSLPLHAADAARHAPAQSRAAIVAALMADPDRLLRIDAPLSAMAGPPDTTPPRADPAVPAGTATARLVLNEGFNFADLKSRDGRFAAPGGIFTEGWIRQNNSDRPSNTWQQGYTSYFLAYDGPNDAYIGSHPFATLSDTGTVSSWLLTPTINFTPTTRLSFFTRETLDNPFPSRLQVRACASGACADVGRLPEDVGGFQAVLADINPTEVVAGYPQQWTRYELSAANGLPTSGSGRIAFRHYVHQNDGVLRGGWIGLDRVVVEQGEGDASPLGLEVTVAPADPANLTACAGGSTVEVAAGDQVNVCYRVTNNSTQPLRYHGLRDDQVGAIFTRREQALAPGESWQYNRIVTVSQSMSPSITWTAQKDPQGYTVDTSQPAAFIDATDGLEIDTTAQSGVELPFPADFDFRLYGDRVDDLCVSGFGVVTNKRAYNGCTYSLPWGFRPLPDSELSIYGSVLALFEGGYQSGGKIYQKTIGTAPNRRYVIEYYQRPVANGSPLPERGLTAEIVLNETSGVIEFQYANVIFGGSPACAYGGCASIGLQSRNFGQQFSYYAQSLRTVNRIVWTPSDPTAYTRTRQLQIAARGAGLQLDAQRIDVTADAAGTATAHLKIANTGDGRLDWQAGVAARNSHLPATPRAVLPLRESGAVSSAFQPLAAAPRSAVAPPGPPGPMAPAAPDDDHTLWAFDVWGGVLISADPAAPGYDATAVYEAGTGLRTITGTDFLDDDFSQLYALDAETHQLLRMGPTTVGGSLAGEELIGVLPIPAGALPSGLKQDPTSGTVYLVTADGIKSYLWTVDVRTAAMRPVGPISGMPGIVSMDFDNDGHLYGIDVVLDALVAIDKSSGAGQVVGSLGMSLGGSISALAFDPAHDERFYLGSVENYNGKFWHVDKATGQATFVTPVNGPDGALAQFGAMAIARPGNRCVELAQVPWLSLSQSGGTIQPGAAQTDLTLQFDAAGLGAGVHTANLCLHSNDVNRRRAAVPVSFTVGNDRIFAAGFETPAQP